SRAARALGGAGEEQEGARQLRVVPAEPPARLQRVDRRGQARGDARRARETGGRMDRRGEVAELEVRTAVSGWVRHALTHSRTHGFFGRTTPSRLHSWTCPSIESGIST